jgi:hypothetical protein
MFSGSFTYLSGVLQACALIVCAFCILQNAAFIHTGETLDVLTAADFTRSLDVVAILQILPIIHQRFLCPTNC